MRLKIALELILRYCLSNKTKILGILEAKTFKMINYTRRVGFGSTSREFQFLRPNKKGFDIMNLEEYKKYVGEVNNNIENLLKDNEEELSFYQLLVKTFNQVCEERNDLEQALDEIEKYMTNYIKVEDGNKNVKIEFNELLKIIQKAKGE